MHLPRNNDLSGKHIAINGELIEIQTILSSPPWFPLNWVIPGLAKA